MNKDISSHEISHDMLKKVKVAWFTDWQNAHFVFLIYTVMVYAFNHKEDFEKESQAFCDDCWNDFNFLLYQFDCLMDRVYKEHNPKLN